MKSRSKKHQRSSSPSPPPPPSTSSDDQRVTTSALSYLKHRLFHSSKSTTNLADRHANVPTTSKSTVKPLPNPQALDIPAPKASPSSTLEIDRPCSKSLENDMYLGRPVFRRTTSDLHSPPTIKKDIPAVNRTSQIIWKEGYLYKRTDFRPFHTHKADRGWKLYRVVLRGHKLYLYRTSTQHQDNFNKSLLTMNSSTSTTSSLPLISHTPSPQPHPPSLSATSTFTTTPSSTIIEKSPIALNPTEFDEQARQYLLTTPSDNLVHAAVFTEWDRQRKQTATAVNLLIYIDCLVVCKKQKQSSGKSSPLWHIQTITPLCQLVLEPCKFTSSTSASSSSSTSLASAPASQSSPSTSMKVTRQGSSSSSLHNATTNDTRCKSQYQHVNYSPDQISPSSTLVNQFALSYVSQPWKQTTYVSLSKELVSSWMMAFYSAQHANSIGKSTTDDILHPQTNDPATDETKQVKSATLGNDGRLKQKSTSVETITFDEASPHPGLVIQPQDDRPVQGGTIPALVHELLFETQQQGKEYTYAFLLTYTMFTTVSEVLDLMKGYLQRLDGTPLGLSLWNRLLELYRIWCVRFAYDVVGDLVTGMMERLDALHGNDTLPLDLRKRGDEIKALVLQTVKDNRHIIEHAQTPRDYNEGTEVVDSIHRFMGENEADSMKSTPPTPTTPASPTSPTKGTASTSPLASLVVDISDLVATGLSPSLFLSMDPARFAEQIYIFHHKQHYQHRYQLLSALSYVSRPQVPPQLLNTLLYTSPSPHFLTRLIWQHVLVETQMQHTDNAMEMRISLLEHWIRVGAALLQLKDMTGWCAVAMGVCSMKIARLKEAWKTVDRSLVKMVARMWGPLLADHGLYSLDVWMEDWEHDERLQHMFSQVLDVDTLGLPTQTFLNEDHPNLRSLPYFGSIKQSVDRMRRHVPLHLSCDVPMNASPSSSTVAVVNFTSSWCVHDTIRSGLGTWKKGRHLTWEENDIKGILPFAVVRPLQMYFDTAVNQVSSVPHDFKYLHECSLACEPRVFGQLLGDRPFKEVTGPSYSPLTFPDTLNSGFTFFPKFASLQLFGQALEKKNSQRMSPSGHEIQLVHLQEQHSSLTQASLSALRKVDASAPENTKRNSAATLFGDDLSQWMDDSFFGAQRQLVKTLKQQLELTQQQRRRNEQGSGIWLFHVCDNTLVLSAQDLLPLPMPSASTSLSDRVSPGRTTWNAATAMINIRAGYIEPLVDVLVHGVGQYKTVIQQQWRALGPSSADQTAEKLNLTIPVMDDEAYMSVFFTTYRMFCSPKHLMTILQDQFIQAKTYGLQAKRRQTEQSKKQRRRMTMMDIGVISTGSTRAENLEAEATAANGETDVLAFDWLVVAKTQLRVVHLLMYWIEKHFYDVVDQIDLLSGMLDLMMTAKTSLALWQLPLAQYYDQQYAAVDAQGSDNDGNGDTCTDAGVEQNIKAALEMGDKIGGRLDQLQTLLARKSISPCYDLKALRYDTQGSRSADELYRQLTYGNQQFSVMLQLATSKTSTFSLTRAPLDDTAASVVDRYPPSTLLEQADRAVRQLFGSVTLQDWIQTTDVLESQSNDLYAWLPARNRKESMLLAMGGGQGGSSAASISTSSSSSSSASLSQSQSQQQQHQYQHQKHQQRPSLMSSALSPVVDAPSAHYSDYHHLHTDEIIISDIFIAIEGARRSMVSPLAFSADDLLLAFPSSLQYLYCMHYIIRSWVIHQVTSSNIDLNTRVARLDTFLQMVRLSRQSCQQMNLFTELKEAAATSATTKDGGNSPTYVPGFVENAIASALVSPEVRLFTKAWKCIGQKYKVSDLDTLAPLLKNMACDASLLATSSSRLDGDLLLTPSIGWIFERIIELSLVVPDTYQGMIHFDKRRYIFRFLELVTNAQVELENQPTPQSIGMSFLISPNNKKPTWKTLKDEAHKEKMQHHHHNRHLHQRNSPNPSNKLKPSTSSASIVSSTSSTSSWHLSTKNGVFSKLVAAQMEKLKRDIKERERIDREWKEVQYKQQKRQMDYQPRNKDDRKPELRHRRHASSSSVNIATTSSLSEQQSTMSSSPSFNGNSPHGLKWPSLLRTLRPPSMVGFHMIDDYLHHQHGDSTRPKKSTLDDGGGMIKAAMVINLIHATTSIASGYEKRPFVFRVVTEEGAQYLLQGANMENMQNWMDEINQAARFGTAKRRSVFAAESQQVDKVESTMESKKGKKKTVTMAPPPRTRTTVYGVALETLKEREHNDVPQLVTKCIMEIERRGLEEVGIYRVAGTGSVVQQLKKAFNTDSENVNVDEQHYPDINVVADALKQFLRELPEPLMTFALYEEFINASASEDHDDRVYNIKQAIQKLPVANYQLLKRLIEHFSVVTDYESINHMYATNLAIVFGPTLLQPTPGPAAFTTSMSNLGHHQNVVKYLILHYHYLFGIEGAE